MYEKMCVWMYFIPAYKLILLLCGFIPLLRPSLCSDLFLFPSRVPSVAILSPTLPHFSLKSQQLWPDQLLRVKYTSERKHGGIGEPVEGEKTTMQLDLEEPDKWVQSLKQHSFAHACDDLYHIYKHKKRLPVWRCHWSVWRRRCTFPPLTGFTGKTAYYTCAYRNYDKFTTISDYGMCDAVALSWVRKRTKGYMASVPTQTDMDTITLVSYKVPNCRLEYPIYENIWKVWCDHVDNNLFIIITTPHFNHGHHHHRYFFYLSPMHFTCSASDCERTGKCCQTHSLICRHSRPS